ncbi:baculoviral IAP repeat-containing protein 7-B-like [Clavelina lepadiformis]|uniref:baculoviral IAP repeat-containing protein 7-B-like n=1 Tax=Clavelina lepadiformis TaxID=159417 RepID=UPI004041AE12
MKSEKSRLQTFLDHSSSWPAHKIRAAPRKIANAGMYYLGVRDRVKCWYCNGGLQNWERDDDPWEEHAKWFPILQNGLRNGDPEIINPREERWRKNLLPIDLEEEGSASVRKKTTPSTKSELEDIRRLQEEKTCKVFGNEQASVVLIPCGHIACCVGCAENASTCPICRLRVREKVRSFIV